MLRMVTLGGRTASRAKREKKSRYANIDAKIPDHDSETRVVHRAAIPGRNSALPKGYWTPDLLLTIMVSIQDA